MFTRNTAIIYTVDYDFRRRECEVTASGHATEVMQAVHDLCTHIFRGHVRWWFQEVKGELSETDAEQVSDMDWKFVIGLGD
jgi:hypothetical protein